MKKVTWVALASVMAFGSMAVLGTQTSNYVIVNKKQETRLTGVREEAKKVSTMDRCLSPLSKEMCKKEREYAYEENCISLAEKEVLRKRKLYPVCYSPRRTNPNNRLGAVCPCKN